MSILISDDNWTNMSAALNGGNMNPFYLNPEERFAATGGPSGSSVLTPIQEVPDAPKVEADVSQSQPDAALPDSGDDTKLPESITPAAAMPSNEKGAVDLPPDPSPGGSADMPVASPVGNGN